MIDDLNPVEFILTFLFGLSHVFWIFIGIVVIKDKVLPLSEDQTAGMDLRARAESAIPIINQAITSELIPNWSTRTGITFNKTTALANSSLAKFPLTKKNKINNLYLVITISILAMSFSIITYGLRSVLP